MDKEKIIKDIEDSVVGYEKSTKQLYTLCVVASLLSILLTATYFYGISQANKLREFSIELTESFKNDEKLYLGQKTIDKKLDLFRTEIKMRYHISGIAGGVLLGFGIGGLFNRKRRLMNLKAMQGVAYLVKNNS